MSLKKNLPDIFVLKILDPESGKFYKMSEIDINKKKTHLFSCYLTNGMQNLILCCSTFKPVEEAQVKRIKLSAIRDDGWVSTKSVVILVCFHNWENS